MVSAGKVQKAVDFLNSANLWGKVDVDNAVTHLITYQRFEEAAQLGYQVVLPKTFSEAIFDGLIAQGRMRKAVRFGRFTGLENTVIASQVIEKLVKARRFLLAAKFAWRVKVLDKLGRPIFDALVDQGYMVEALEFAQACGLAGKVDVEMAIQKLIDRGKLDDARKFASDFGLAEKFPQLFQENK
ncbi:MAG: hypothetical protein RMJ16_15115 [Thermoguttaceae bacterium]|nr:hypothetical protein [Thermoguttaceae bacterium]